MIKNKNLRFILPTFFSSSLAFAIPCPFDQSQSCELITDILQDKASSGLNYYAATNYDHRMSGEINLYDVSKVVNKGSSLTLLANRVNNTLWRSGEIMTRANLNSPPYNSPTASEVWTTKEAKHGYIEVNIDLPKCTQSTDGLCQQGKNPANYNRGLWPAIWMMPTYDSNWPQNGEIDIMEAYHKTTAFNVTTAALHFNGNDPQCGGNDCRGWGYSLDSHQFPELAYNKPHTWGFEWEEDPASQNGGYIITGYIDQVKAWGPLKTDSLPADGPNALRRGFNDANGGYYLIINLAVGGPYAGDPNPQMQAASMNINSVKFYQVEQAPPASQCNVPADLASFYSADKKSVMLSWKAPKTGGTPHTYQVKDWQKKVLWQGSQLNWTDALPGKAGKYTYYLNSICCNGISTDLKFEVIIPETAQCAEPANVTATHTADKKNISLSWNQPAASLPINSYQVRDWQERVLWQGNQLNWTDKFLPGKSGRFTYYINSVCTESSSSRVKKEVFIP